MHAQERDTVPLTLHHVPIRLEPSAHRHPSQRESGVKAVEGRSRLPYMGNDGRADEYGPGKKKWKLSRGKLTLYF